MKRDSLKHKHKATALWGRSETEVCRGSEALRDTSLHVDPNNSWFQCLDHCHVCSSQIKRVIPDQFIMFQNRPVNVNRVSQTAPRTKRLWMPRMIYKTIKTSKTVLRDANNNNNNNKSLRFIWILKAKKRKKNIYILKYYKLKKVKILK